MAKMRSSPPWKLPVSAMISAPTISAPITGGSTRARRGTAVSATKASVIGTASPKLSRIA